MKLKDKRAAEMTVGTIIIIILALVVLVFLIFGFTKGTGNLFENIKNFFGGGANIQTVVTSCQTACATNSVYEWCRYRAVRFQTGGKTESLRCLDLTNLNVGLDTCPGITTCAAACIGTPKACSDTSYDQTKCENNAKANGGCSWDKDRAVCEGTAKSCSIIRLEANCTPVLGCEWK